MPHIRLFAWLLSLLALTFSLFSCSPAAPSSGKPVVMCTIFAYYDAARAIAGDKLDVQILLPAFASPHEYETTGADKKTAANARLFIKNGLGLDDRFDKLHEGSAAKTLTVSQQIPQSMFLTTEELSLDDPASAPATSSAGPLSPNPHIWLDPQIQIKAAEIIRDALIDLDPADKADFQKNATAYIDDLKKLDADFASAAATFKTKDFIGFHSAYEYLAHRYGLRQIASVEEFPGTGLSAAQAQKIIAVIQTNHIQYIAIESAFPEQSLNLITQQTGVHTIVMQPLETYDNKSDSYLSYMRANLAALRTALGTKN